MVFNIFYGKSLNKVNQKVLSFIKSARQPNLKNIIITPDRMTLLTEKSLFDAIGEECFFDVNVTTLTRLSSEVCERAGAGVRVLTKPMAVTIVKKVLLEQEANFKALSKSIQFNGTAENLYETICMFKSCKITPQDIDVGTKSTNLNAKLADIKLVYEKYEEFLQQDYTDSFNRLTLFETLITKEQFKNVNCYFLGFLQFTPQMYGILQKLITCCNSVSFACAASYKNTQLTNAHIYDNNLYLNLISLAKTMGVQANLHFEPCLFPNAREAMANHLFGYKLPLTELNGYNAKVLTFNNIDQEIEFACKVIRNKIISGAQYNSFSIVAGGLASYENKIKEYFIKYQIPYYIDVNKPITGNVLVRMVLDAFALVENNFSGSSLLHFIKTYSNESLYKIGSLENAVKSLSVNGNELISQLFEIKDLPCKEIIQALQFFWNGCEKENTVAEFIAKVRKLLQQLNVTNFYNNLYNGFLEENNILAYKQIPQVLNKLETCLTSLEELVGTYTCTFKNFKEITECYLSSVSISMPPIVADCVFIGDALTSFIEENKTVFVINAAEGQMPAYLNDVGLISDAEIAFMQQKNKLSPTVAEINKRNKYKVYENLLLARQELIISYNGKIPAAFVSAVGKLFNIETINGSFILSGLIRYEGLDTFVFNNTVKQDAEFNLIKHIKDYNIRSNDKVFLSNMDSLRQSVENSGEIMARNSYENVAENVSVNNLFFSKGKTSPSQMESFFSCPYKHFLSYGLSLQEQDSREITPRILGSIVHAFTEKTLPLVVKGEKVDVGNILTAVLSQPEFVALSKNPYNKNVIKGLYREAEFLTQAFIAEQKVSAFKPVYLEYPVSGIEVNINGKKITVSGIIDRVDEFEDKFRIIDYKTGQADMTDFTEVISGKKIQLLLYTQAYKEKSGKTPAGLFYLPVRNEFIKTESVLDSYKLKGMLIDELSTIFAMDNSIGEASPESRVLNGKLTSKGFTAKKSLLLISETDLNKLCNYVMQLIQVAATEIAAGKVSKTPLRIGKKTACDYCNCLGICNFNRAYKNRFRTVKPVKLLQEAEL